MTHKETIVWAEMARRKIAFHNSEDWNKIKLWGLFSWGMVSSLIKKGELLTDMTKENKTVWVRPSEKAYNEKIKPLLCHPLPSLEKMAGW